MIYFMSVEMLLKCNIVCPTKLHNKMVDQKFKIIHISTEMHLHGPHSSSLNEKKVPCKWAHKSRWCLFAIERGRFLKFPICALKISILGLHPHTPCAHCVLYDHGSVPNIFNNQLTSSIFFVCVPCNAFWVSAKCLDSKI